MGKETGHRIGLCLGTAVLDRVNAYIWPIFRIAGAQANSGFIKMISTACEHIILDFSAYCY